MPEKQNINAAYRLHQILKAAVAQQPNVSNLQVWSNVFDVQHSGRRQKQAVNRGIDLIYDQLDILVGYLKRNEYAEEVIQDLVNAIEVNISMEFAHQPWLDFRQRLNNQIIPLRIYSNALPSEESLISPADLKDIQDELDALQLSLDNKDIPAEVRDYVKKQFDFIRRAFWEYKFRGLHAFDDALMDGVRESYVQQATVEKHKNDPEVQEVSKMWGKVWQAVIKAGQAGTALTAGQHFYQLVASTLKLTGHH